MKRRVAKALILPMPLRRQRMKKSATEAPSDTVGLPQPPARNDTTHSILGR